MNKDIKTLKKQVHKKESKIPDKTIKKKYIHNFKINPSKTLKKNKNKIPNTNSNKPEKTFKKIRKNVKRIMQRNKTISKIRKIDKKTNKKTNKKRKGQSGGGKLTSSFFEEISYEDILSLTNLKDVALEEDKDLEDNNYYKIIEFLRARYCLPEMSNYKELISENKDPLLNQHVFRPVSLKIKGNSNSIYYDNYEDILHFDIEKPDSRGVNDYNKKSNLSKYSNRINHPNNFLFNRFIEDLKKGKLSNIYNILSESIRDDIQTKVMIKIENQGNLLDQKFLSKFIYSLLFLFFTYKLDPSVFLKTTDLSKYDNFKKDIQLWGNKFINEKYEEYLKDYHVKGSKKQQLRSLSPDGTEELTFEKIESDLEEKNIYTYGNLKEINKKIKETQLKPGTIIQKDNKLFLGTVLKNNIIKNEDNSNDYENSEIVVNYGDISNISIAKNSSLQEYIHFYKIKNVYEEFIHTSKFGYFLKDEKEKSVKIRKLIIETLKNIQGDLVENYLGKMFSKKFWMINLDYGRYFIKDFVLFNKKEQSKYKHLTIYNNIGDPQINTPVTYSKNWDKKMKDIYSSDGIFYENPYITHNYINMIKNIFPNILQNIDESGKYKNIFMELINSGGSSVIDFNKIEKIYNYFIDTNEDITVFFGDLPYDLIPEEKDPRKIIIYNELCRNIINDYLHNDEATTYNNILTEHLRIVNNLNIRNFNIENVFNYLFSDIIVNPDISSTEFNKSLFQNIQDTIEKSKTVNFYNLIGKPLISPENVSNITPRQLYYTKDISFISDDVLKLEDIQKIYDKDIVIVNNCIIDLQGINEKLFHYGKGTPSPKDFEDNQDNAVRCLHIYLKLILYSNIDTIIFAKSYDDFVKKIEKNDDIYIKTGRFKDIRFSDKICKIIKSENTDFEVEYLIQCTNESFEKFATMEYIEQYNENFIDTFKPIEKIITKGEIEDIIVDQTEDDFLEYKEKILKIHLMNIHYEFIHACQFINSELFSLDEDKIKQKYKTFIEPRDLTNQYEIQLEHEWIPAKFKGMVEEGYEFEDPLDPSKTIKINNMMNMRIKKELEVEELYYPKHEKIDPDSYERETPSSGVERVNNIYNYRVKLKNENKNDLSYSITDKEANIDLHVPFFIERFGGYDSVNIKNDLITYNTLLFSDKIEKMLKYTDRTDKLFKNTFSAGNTIYYPTICEKQDDSHHEYKDSNKDPKYEYELYRYEDKTNGRYFIVHLPIIENMELSNIDESLRNLIRDKKYNYSENNKLKNIGTYGIHLLKHLDIPFSKGEKVKIYSQAAKSWVAGTVNDLVAEGKAVVYYQASGQLMQKTITKGDKNFLRNFNESPVWNQVSYTDSNGKEKSVGPLIEKKIEPPSADFHPDKIIRGFPYKMDESETGYLYEDELKRIRLKMIKLVFGNFINKTILNKYNSLGNEIININDNILPIQIVCNDDPLINLGLYNKLGIQNTLTKLNKFNKNNFFEETDSTYLNDGDETILEQSNNYYNENVYNSDNGYSKYMKQIITKEYEKIYKTKKFEANKLTGFYDVQKYGELLRKKWWGGYEFDDNEISVEMNYIDLSIEINDSFKSLINNLIFQYTEIIGIQLLKKIFINEEISYGNITLIDLLQKTIQSNNIKTEFKDIIKNYINGEIQDGENITRIQEEEALQEALVRKEKTTGAASGAALVGTGAAAVAVAADIFLTAGIITIGSLISAAAAGGAAGGAAGTVAGWSITDVKLSDIERLTTNEKFNFESSLKILKEIKKFPNFYENEYSNYQIKQEFNLIFMTYQLIKKQISIKPDKKDITTEIPINIPEGTTIGIYKKLKEYYGKDTNIFNININSLYESLIDILKQDYDLDKKSNYVNYNSYFNYPKHTDKKKRWFKKNFNKNDSELNSLEINKFEKFLEEQYNKIIKFTDWNSKLTSNKSEIIKFQKKLRKSFKFFDNKECSFELYDDITKKPKYEVYFEKINTKYERIINKIKQLQNFEEIQIKFEEEISKNLSKNDIRNMFFFNYKRIDDHEQSTYNILEILNSFSEYNEFWPNKRNEIYHHSSTKKLNDTYQIVEEIKTKLEGEKLNTLHQESLDLLEERKSNINRIIIIKNDEKETKEKNIDKYGITTEKTEELQILKTQIEDYKKEKITIETEIKNKLRTTDLIDSIDSLSKINELKKNRIEFSFTDMYKYNEYLKGPLELFKKSDYFKDRIDKNPSKFKITDLFIIKEFIIGINNIKELINLQDENIILENDIIEYTRKYNNAYIVILHYRKVIKKNIQKKINIYLDLKINLQNYKILKLEEDQRVKIDTILTIIETIIDKHNDAIDKLFEEDYSKNLEIIKINIESITSDDKKIEMLIKEFCGENDIPELKETLCEELLNIYNKTFYLKSHQITIKNCILSLSGKFMISKNKAEKQLKQLIEDFKIQSVLNDNVIHWINPIEINDSNDGIKPSKYTISYKHSENKLQDEIASSESSALSSEVKKETLNISDKKINVVIYYNEDKNSECYVIGKIIKKISEDQYLIKPYFSLNEDKLFYQNKDIVIYKTESGSGKYEIEKNDEGIIKLKKVREDILKYNYENVTEKTLSDSPGKIINEGQFTEIVEYWSGVKTKTVNSDNIITYNRLKDYLNNKQIKHDDHDIPSSEIKNSSRKSEIYKKYIQLRLDILELYKKYIINESKREDNADYEDDDEYDMYDNTNIMKLNDIITAKKIIHDLFSKIKKKRSKEEINELRELEKKKKFEENRKAVIEAEEELRKQEEELTRILSQITEAEMSKEQRDRDALGQKEAEKEEQLRKLREEKAKVEAEKQREMEEQRKIKEAIDLEKVKKYKEDKINYKDTKKQHSLVKNRSNYSKYILNNFIDFIEKIKELSISTEDYIIKKHDEKIKKLRLLLNNFNYEYLFLIMIDNLKKIYKDNSNTPPTYFKREIGLDIDIRISSDELRIIQQFEEGIKGNNFEFPDDFYDKIVNKTDGSKPNISGILESEKIMIINTERERVNNVTIIIEEIIEYFREIGYEILSNITEIETKNNLQIIENYYEIVYNDQSFEIGDNSQDELNEINKEIRSILDKNLSVKTIEKTITDFIEKKKYLKGFNLIIASFYIFSDKEQLGNANKLKESICNRMKEDHKYYNVTKMLFLKEINNLYSYNDIELSNLVQNTGSGEFLFDKINLDEIIKKYSIHWSEWPNIIDKILHDKRFNRTKIDFLETHDGLEFHNMHIDKILKRKRGLPDPLKTDNVCSNINFYQILTELPNFSDYNNSDDLFTNLYGQESYDGTLKEKIKSIIDFKIKNIKELPYNFSLKGANGKIYKYIFTDGKTYYFYEFKENIYFDIELPVRIKVGIKFHGIEYFGEEEFTIDLYSLISKLSENNKIENYSEIEEQYKIIKIMINNPPDSEITYIFNFVGFESKDISNFILDNENTELDTEEDINYEKITSFLKAIKRNKYINIIKQFGINNGSFKKGGIEFPLTSIKNDIIEKIKEKLDISEEIFKSNIENLDNCIITNEYIFNLHWNLMCRNSEIIKTTSIGGNYNINYFNNKTDKMGIPNLIYSDIYQEYYIKTKMKDIREKDKTKIIEEKFKEFCIKLVKKIKQILGINNSLKRTNQEYIVSLLILQKSKDYIKYLERDPPIIDGEIEDIRLKFEKLMREQTMDINDKDFSEIDNLNIFNYLMYPGEEKENRGINYLKFISYYGEINKEIKNLCKFILSILAEKTELDALKGKKINIPNDVILIRERKYIEIGDIFHIEEVISLIISIIKKKNDREREVEITEEQLIKERQRQKIIDENIMILEQLEKNIKDEGREKISDVEKIWYFGDLQTGVPSERDLEMKIKEKIKLYNNDFEDLLCHEFKQKPEIQLSEERDLSKKDFVQLKENIKKEELTDYKINKDEKDSDIIHIWNKTFPYNFHQEKDNFTKWVLEKKDGETKPVYIDFQTMNSLYNTENIDTEIKIKSYNLGYVVSDDNKKYSYCEIMKNYKDIEKIYKKTADIEDNQSYIQLIKSGENICHLHVSNDDCEEINIKESIFSRTLEYIYTFVCYILKISDISEFNLYFAHKSDKSYLYLLVKDGDDIFIKKVSEEIDNPNKLNYFIFNEILYNYENKVDDEIDIDQLKIHTKILLFPSYFKDQNHINIYPELLPGYFQMFDYFSKIQLRRIYNKFTKTLSDIINGEEEVLRKKLIEDLTKNGIIHEIDGIKKIEWITLITKFQNTQEYINWATKRDNRFILDIIQIENNTNLEYLKTKIYSKYENGYNEIKQTLKSFQYYKNNIDSICILFEDYKKKIENKILHNHGLEYEKIKEKLLGIQIEIEEVIKEILVIQKEFFKKQIKISNKLQLCIASVLQDHINKITDLKSLINSSLISCELNIATLMKLKGVTDSKIQGEYILDQYKTIIDNSNLQLLEAEWDIKNNLKILEKENLSTTQSLNKSTLLITEIFDSFNFIFLYLQMKILSDEDTQEPDNIQQIIKNISLIEREIETKKIYKDAIFESFTKFKENIMKLLLLIVNEFINKIDANFEFIRRNIIVIKGIEQNKSKVHSDINTEDYENYKKTDRHKIPILSHEKNKLITKYKLDDSRLQLSINKKKMFLGISMKKILDIWDTIIENYKKDKIKRNKFKELICLDVNQLIKLGESINKTMIDKAISKNSCVSE